MKRVKGYMPYNDTAGEFAKSLRLNTTLAEKRMWTVLRRRSVEGCRFVRQKPILSYVADFYCAELLLIIEIDGSSHDQKRDMDINRTIELEEYGFTIIRYTNDQVLYSLAEVISDLKSKMKFLRHVV